MARGPGVTDPEPRLAAGVALHPHTRTSERQDRARAEEPGSQELRAGCFGSSPRPPLPLTGSSDAPGRVCLSFIFASTVPSPPWPAPSSRKPRTLRPAPPPGAESPRTSPSPRACGPRLLPACPTLLATLAASLLR